jgi:hypothetical protein
MSKRSESEVCNNLLELISVELTHQIFELLGREWCQMISRIYERRNFLGGEGMHGRHWRGGGKESECDVHDVLHDLRVSAGVKESEK